jgi:hypothetical protein
MGGPLGTNASHDAGAIRQHLAWPRRLQRNRVLPPLPGKLTHDRLVHDPAVHHLSASLGGRRAYRSGAAAVDGGVPEGTAKFGTVRSKLGTSKGGRINGSSRGRRNQSCRLAIPIRMSSHQTCFTDIV